MIMVEKIFPTASILRFVSIRYDDDTLLVNRTKAIGKETTSSVVLLHAFYSKHR